MFENIYFHRVEKLNTFPGIAKYKYCLEYCIGNKINNKNG